MSQCDPARPDLDAYPPVGKKSLESLKLDKPVETPIDQVPPVIPENSQNTSLDTVCKIKRVKQSNWTFAFTISMALAFGGYTYVKEADRIKAANLAELNRQQIAKQQEEITKNREMIDELSEWYYGSTDAALVGVSYGGKIMLWNKGSERIFGYTSKYAIGKSINLVIPEKYRYGHDGAFSKAAQSSAFKAKIVKCEGLDHAGHLMPITMTLRRYKHAFIATIYLDSEVKVIDLIKSPPPMAPNNAATAQPK